MDTGCNNIIFTYKFNSEYNYYVCKYINLKIYLKN